MARSHVMVQDATRLTAAAVRMVTAGGVLSVLHPLMLPLLLLAVVPAAVEAVLHAKVTYETRRVLDVAPRMLRIVLASSAIGGVFLVATWAVLAWLAATGQVEPAVAATAVVAVQSTLAALSQLVIHGAAMFHTALYLADMDTFLTHAAERAPKRCESVIGARSRRSVSTRSSTAIRAGPLRPSTESR